MTDEGQVVLTSGTATGTLDCPNCAERVATRVRGLPGIRTVILDTEPSPARLRYTYETETVTPATVEDLVAREMADSEAHYVHQVLAIEGMDCADCALTIEKAPLVRTGSLLVCLVHRVAHHKLKFSFTGSEREFLCLLGRDLKRDGPD